MPASTVANQYGVRAFSNLRANLLEMLVHRFRVDSWHDNGGASGPFRADRAEKISRCVEIVANRQRARINLCPYIGMSAFLTCSGLILEPNLYRCAGTTIQQRGLHNIREVYGMGRPPASMGYYGWRF